MFITDVRKLPRFVITMRDGRVVTRSAEFNPDQDRGRPVLRPGGLVARLKAMLAGR
jgi:hypothetical protein